jgi:hypothetical protein
MFAASDNMAHFQNARTMKIRATVAGAFTQQFEPRFGDVEIYTNTSMVYKITGGSSIVRTSARLGVFSGNEAITNINQYAEFIYNDFVKAYGNFDLRGINVTLLAGGSIYLKQTGRYWIVNKIENLQRGRLAKVELIKLI